MKYKVTLEAARVMSGLSIKDAAKLFGVHHETLSRWEKNPANMKQKDVGKIQGVYGVGVDKIFFGTENEFIRFKEKNELYI